MYFKLLETFVLKILFSKDEYNITSKNFNPIRFFVISLLVLNVFFTAYLLTRLNRVYVKVEAVCPAAIEEMIKLKKLPKTIAVVPVKK